MQSDDTLNDISNEVKPNVSNESLHDQAKKYISEFNQLVLENLPAVISQIIEQKIWKQKGNPYQNFGEYALDKSSEGLGISNNEMLWLLRSAMNINSNHVSHWGDVLSTVDNSVRVYAKENKIPVKDLNNDLKEQDSPNQENHITYLPSRSRSIDGQLLKLKHKDPDAYESVIQGTLNIKDTMVKAPRKKQQPIEAVKNKFFNLSKSDRLAFLEWLEQEKDNLD